MLSKCINLDSNRSNYTNSKVKNLNINKSLLTFILEESYKKLEKIDMKENEGKIMKAMNVLLND